MIKALGGRRSMILKQFLLEASLVVAAAARWASWPDGALTMLIGTMPFLGPAFKDTTHTGDIHLGVSLDVNCGFNDGAVSGGPHRRPGAGTQGGARWTRSRPCTTSSGGAAEHS